MLATQKPKKDCGDSGNSVERKHKRCAPKNCNHFWEQSTSKLLSFEINTNLGIGLVLLPP